MTQENKKWFKSKTKWAAVLGGAALVLGTVAGFLSGNIAFWPAFQAVAVEVALILGIFGVRDLPFINRNK